jgi:hypothetical protein
MVDYVKIPIIPFQFYGEVEKLWTSTNKRDKYEIQRYEVPVGMSILKKSKPVQIRSDMNLLNIYEIKYDEEIGVFFDKEEDAWFD